MRNRIDKMDIVANRKRFFIFSAVLIVAIFVYAVTFGVSMDVQFKGGAIISYSYENEIAENALASDITGILGSDTSVQFGSNIATGTNSITVTMAGTKTVTADTLEKIQSMLDENYKDNTFVQLEANNVDAAIGKEFFIKSIVAVLAAFVLILLYIAFRFKNIGGWPAGIMAIVALIHDLIMVFGVFVFLRIPLNGNFIAVMLTILGYSINDTVVIYDRIRENETLNLKLSFDRLVNLSINQSFVRSINTTVSTVIALSSVCIVSIIFGLNSIFTFAFPLIIGMISGVYSTICIAGPLWVEWEQHKPKRAKTK